MSFLPFLQALDSICLKYTGYICNLHHILHDTVDLSNCLEFLNYSEFNEITKYKHLPKPPQTNNVILPILYQMVIKFTLISCSTIVCIIYKKKKFEKRENNPKSSIWTNILFVSLFNQITLYNFHCMPVARIEDILRIPRNLYIYTVTLNT